MIQLLLCTAALVLSFVPRVAAPGPEFDLDEFKKTYVRSSLTHPKDDPLSDPDHAKFDPFKIPMPLIKPGVDPEVAFNALDTNGDHMITGEEFAAIPKSEHFNTISRDEMDQKWAVFGMSLEMFKSRHGGQHDDNKMHTAFHDHDTDGNKKLFKSEYEAALKRLDGL